MRPIAAKSGLALSAALWAFPACTPAPKAPAPVPPAAHPPPVTASVAAPPSADATPEPPRPVVVPEKLRAVAASFGMTMTGAGWQFEELDRHTTRLDWSGRPPNGAFETRYSFYVNGDDMRALKPLLLPVIESTVANFTDKEPCRAFEQPTEIARLLGAERVVSVCFEPAKWMGDELHFGVMHGLVRGDTFVIVVVLSNDHAGIVPLEKWIGGRFTAR